MRATDRVEDVFLKGAGRRGQIGRAGEDSAVAFDQTERPSQLQSAGPLLPKKAYGTVVSLHIKFFHRTRIAAVRQRLCVNLARLQSPTPVKSMKALVIYVD
jgi:hypothetical protein